MALSEALIPPLKNESDLETYTYRWAVLVMFILAGVANALILLSFSPITNLAESYWGVSITAVNLLTVSFQIMYLPGTVLALYISKYYDLRTLMLSGGLLTLVGCGVRYIGAVSKGDNGLNNDGSYGIILLGTFIVAAAQPFYLNMPARIAAVWFPLKERDISTTFGSLANPLGSAIGSVIPPLFVTETNLNGVKDLLLCHLVVAAVTFSLTLVAFRSQPPKPPTLSAMAMGESLKSEGSNNLKAELFKLFENKNYLFLLFSFTISLSNLNALAALLNQLPGEYDNGQVGLTGAALILSGFLGAFVAGFVLNYTKAYRTILKATYSAAFVAWVIFMCSCGKGNFPFFISGAVLLGLTLLPTIPATIINSVETSYPAREDLALGLLYIGANTVAIAMTFIGQELLLKPEFGPAPLFPYSVWVLGTMALALVPILLFNGRYLRLEKDIGDSSPVVASPVGSQAVGY